MNSGERGMNPVAMTIINPGKEYWLNCGSNQGTPVLKSCTLPTEHGAWQGTAWLSCDVGPGFEHWILWTFVGVSLGKTIQRPGLVLVKCRKDAIQSINM